MMSGLFIECRVDHFPAVQAPLHVGHFFRSLIYQKHDELDIRILVFDRCRDLLEKDCFTGFRLCNDESPLASSDRRDKVHHSCRKIYARIFQHDLLVRENRCEVVKMRTSSGHSRIHSVDFFDIKQCAEPFIRAWSSGDAEDLVACSQAKTSDLAV